MFNPVPSRSPSRSLIDDMEHHCLEGRNQSLQTDYWQTTSPAGLELLGIRCCCSVLLYRGKDVANSRSSRGSPNMTAVGCLTVGVIKLSCSPVFRLTLVLEQSFLTAVRVSSVNSTRRQNFGSFIANFVANASRRLRCR